MLIDKVSNIFDVELSTLRIPKFTEASWVASIRLRRNKFMRFDSNTQEKELEFLDLIAKTHPAQYLQHKY